MYPRWNTFEPGILPEEVERTRIASLIDRWWECFANRCDDIAALFSRKQYWDLPAWMQENLQVISPSLMWEFGPGLEEGHRLVVTTEHRLNLRPLVDEILRRAPVIQGWTFYGHRLRESLDVALATVEARTGVPLEATGFKCAKGRFNLVDVAIEFPRSTLRKDRELANSQAFIILESMIGEAALNTWVGAIEVEPKGWRSHPIAGLPAAVDELTNEILGSLSDTPLAVSPGDGTWSLLEIEAEPANDYPAQRDLFVGKTVNTELWQNAHADVRFYSQRYSVCGEVFCYLKMDGIDASDEVFKDKGDIEDALDERLRAEGLGCFVGGGTGLRYSYVDLAVTDLTRALPVIRGVLQGGNLTMRSWVQFYDSEWEYEWVGIWKDSPPPPLVADA